jgi:hypothetical protein
MNIGYENNYNVNDLMMMPFGDLPPEVQLYLSDKQQINGEIWDGCPNLRYDFLSSMSEGDVRQYKELLSGNYTPHM